MRVFVLGATGYIGSVVAEKLLRAGHEVMGLARSDASAHVLEFQGIEPVLGSLEDLPILTAAAQKVDAVVQAAFSQDGPDFVAATRTDRAAVRALLDALEGTDKPLLVTSGTAVLGDTGDLVYDEETPIILPDADEVEGARSGLLQALRDRLAMEREVRERRGVRGIVVRPPNVYGRSDGKSVLTLLREAGSALGAVPYAAGSANNKWSFVHVDDLADLYLLALERAGAGELFHAGAQSGLRTQSIAEAVSRGLGLGGKTIELGIPQLGEALGVPALAPYWASNSQSSSEKARRVLGWKPRHVDMVEEIASRHDNANINND